MSLEAEEVTLAEYECQAAERWRLNPLRGHIGGHGAPRPIGVGEKPGCKTGWREPDW